MLLAGGAGVGLAAQSALEPAYMLRGPVAVTGIPYLGPNLLAGSQAVYVVAGQQVTVTYTRQLVAVPPAWRRATCAGTAVALLAQPELLTVVVADQQREHTVFVAFPQPSATPWCRFVARLTERLHYFLGFVEHAADVPFPAVIELAAD